MEYTEKTIIFESFNSFTLILRVSNAKKRLKMSSTPLYARRMGIQMLLVGDVHILYFAGNSPV